MRFLLGKIILAVGLLLSLVIVVFYFTASHTGNAMLTNFAHARSQGVVDVGLTAIEHLMASNHKSEVSAGLSSIVRTQAAINACILTPDGRIHYSSDSALIGTVVPISTFLVQPDLPRHRYKFIGADSTYCEVFLAPIFNKAECRRCHNSEGELLAYFQVTTPLHDIRTISNQHRMSNIAISIAIFFSLGVMLFVTLNLLVIRPVRKLEGFITDTESHIPSLERGDLDALPREVPISGRDEISRLGISLQKMIDKLNDAHTEIIALHNAQLERADQLATTGEMAASMAHEIRNPVAGVMAALQVFRREQHADAPRAEIIDEMLVQLNRISQAVDDLLQYARLAPPNFDCVDVNELLNRTIGLLRAQLPASIEIVLHYDHDAPCVRADIQQTQQVFWNLLLNAAQAMDGRGVLTLTSALEDESVRITISDTGKGIPEETVHRIFKPFFTTKHKGTGLGLSICKRIMDQHGGSIVISSVEGKGSTVTLTFPPHRPQESV
jgi:signal transduction histidine kinase